MGLELALKLESVEEGGSEVLLDGLQHIVLNLLRVPEDELLHRNELSINELHHDWVLVLLFGQVRLNLR